MTPEERIVALEAQVAALTAQVKRMESVFIHRDKDARGPAMTGLRAPLFQLTSVENPAQVQAMLFSDETGPALILWDKRKRGSITIGFDANGGPSVSMGGVDEKRLATLGTDEKGCGFLSLYDEVGGQRVSIRAPRTGGALGLMGSDGSVRASLRVDERGNGESLLFTSKRMKLAELRVVEGVPSFALFGAKDSKVVAAAEAIGGVLAVTPATGAGGVQMRATPDAHCVAITGPGSLDEGVTMGSLKGSARIWMRHPDGSEAVTLETLAGGSFLKLTSGDACTELSALDMGGRLVLSAGKGQPVASLWTQAASANLTLCGPGVPEGIRLHSQADQQTLLLHPPGCLGYAVLASKTETRSMMAAPQEGLANIQMLAKEDGSQLLLYGNEETLQVAVASTPTGGIVRLHNEIGIAGVDLAVLKDGGGMKLSWGGIPCVFAHAAANGGTVVVNDGKGEVLDVLPGSNADPERMNESEE